MWSNCRSMTEMNKGFEAERMFSSVSVVHVSKCGCCGVIIGCDRSVSVLLSAVFMGHFSCGV